MHHYSCSGCRFGKEISVWENGKMKVVFLHFLEKEHVKLRHEKVVIIESHKEICKIAAGNIIPPLQYQT